MREEVQLFRHMLATLAYRSQKAVHNTPREYPEFSPGLGAKSPHELVNHLNHLMQFVIGLLEKPGLENLKVDKPEPKSWDEEIEYLVTNIKRADTLAENYNGDLDNLKTVVQGPLSDALTHTGQLSYLRRLVGSPASRESFMNAEIETGKVDYFIVNKIKN